MNDGGPAFPQTMGVMEAAMAKVKSGMTLEDFFASTERSTPPLSWWQARVGSQLGSYAELKGVELSEGLAAWRYQCAQAMLNERDKYKKKESQP